MVLNNELVVHDILAYWNDIVSFRRNKQIAK